MSKQILVVGDDADFIHQLKDAYSQTDMTIANASDCSIGLELVYNTRYNLIILLEDLLKKSVYDISYKLNLSQHNMPIIVITSQLTSDKILIANELEIYDIHDRAGEFRDIILSIDKAVNL